MISQLQSERILSPDHYSLLWMVEYWSHDTASACGFHRLAQTRGDDNEALGYDRSLVIDEMVADGLVAERCFIGMVEYVITPQGLELLRRDTPNHPRRDVVNGMVIVRL